MAAHTKVAGVVKEQDTGDAVVLRGFYQQRANQGVRAARLEIDGPADVIELAFETLDTLAHAARAQVRPAVNNDARWLAFGMGIDKSHRKLLAKRTQYSIEFPLLLSI